MNEEKKKIVGILGLGEVGLAIAKACRKYYSVFAKDLTHDSLKKNRIDILHICIPFINWQQFSEPVLKQIKINKPGLVIIDSTVAPGTSRKIEKKSKIPTVHAPIMGIHPDLYDYLFVFPKFIGGISRKGRNLAVSHFKILGLKIINFKKAEETEVAKLMCTTYYGLTIIFCKWLKRYCDKNNLSFEDIYTTFNKAYNEGYSQSLPHVRRPVLKPIPGKIGGHCVIPNTKILDKTIKDPFSRLILSLDKVFAHEKKD